MQVIFTPATERAIAEARRWSSGPDPIDPADTELHTVPMLIGLLAEEECRAAVILQKQNITIKTLNQHWPKLCKRADGLLDVPVRQESPQYPGNAVSLPGGIKPSTDLLLSLGIVAQWLSDNHQNLELPTEHVLLGLAWADHELGRWLRQNGVDPQSIREEIARLYGWPLDRASTDRATVLRRSPSPCRTKSSRSQWTAPSMAICWPNFLTARRKN